MYTSDFTTYYFLHLSSRLPIQSHNILYLQFSFLTSCFIKTKPAVGQNETCKSTKSESFRVLLDLKKCIALNSTMIGSKSILYVNYVKVCLQERGVEAGNNPQTVLLGYIYLDV